MKRDRAIERKALASEGEFLIKPLFSATGLLPTVAVVWEFSV